MMSGDNGERNINDDNDDDDNDDIVEQWLMKMTLEEQIGQMSQIDINLLLEDDDDNNNGGGKRLNMKLVERYIGEMAVGSVLNTVAGGSQWTARQYREIAIALNHVATQQYHHPPILWGLDSIHGANYIQNAILTPQPINIAATWNVTAAMRAGTLASRDTRAAGIQWIFAPLLGLAMEPKWSRVYETFGEDPLLVGTMGQAMIEGIQQVTTTLPDHGTGTGTGTGTSIPSRAAACAKHFIGYSMPRTGHDRSPSWIPTRHLYQYFVPPWERALFMNRNHSNTKNDTTTSDNCNYGVAKTVMESYTEIDGVPMVANEQLLNYLLRYRLNFSGVVVTDYEEIRNLHHWHHSTATDPDAIIQAVQVRNGVDMSMIPWDVNGFVTSIVAGIQSQQVSRDRIRQSARRVLQLKHDLHMFHETMTMVDPNLDLVGTDEASIMPMVQESIVLVENKHNVLPLDIHTPLKIHITGPTANSRTMQSGGWTYQWQGSPNENMFTYGSTVVDAFRNSSNNGADQWSVTYSCGVNVLGTECDDPDDSDETNLMDQVKHWVGLTPTTSIAQAVQGAKGADITVVCLGEEAYTEKPGDIRSLRLPDGQYDLIHAIQRNTDTTIVVVYFGGRARLLSDIVDEVDAVILGFLPGPSAGTAVVDIISGKINPSGHLPITYPSSDDGGGIPYWHAVTDQCTDGEVGTMLPHYAYVPCPVQWEFGHGLSYTSFKYSKFSAVGGIDDDMHIQLDVTNVGSRVGADTVMFFTFDESRRTTPEYKRLRAFEKIILQPGETVTVKQVVSIDTLQFIGPNDDTHYIVDPDMISYVGAGYMVDCRSRDSNNNPDTNKLCIRLQGRQRSKPYVPACEAACKVWNDSGCIVDMTSTMCVDTCISSAPDRNNIENDGWGWNYVNCIENVVWDVKQSLRAEEKMASDESCLLMTTLCRDVFQTNISAFTESDQTFRTSSSSPSQNGFDNNGTPPSFYVAFASCLLSLLVISYLIRGYTPISKRSESSNEGENFRGIQFTVIASNGFD